MVAKTVAFLYFYGFQCSSASRKFLNLALSMWKSGRPTRFSALQRAENSSISIVTVNQHYHTGFQCSSASRKFLNATVASFSHRDQFTVSVLFSEPKIPQFYADRVNIVDIRVSVLFSEPKIPQLNSSAFGSRTPSAFQCSSASRKFLNQWRMRSFSANRASFSALQRAENSSI